MDIHIYLCKYILMVKKIAKYLETKNYKHTHLYVCITSDCRSNSI